MNASEAECMRIYFEKESNHKGHEGNTKENRANHKGHRGHREDVSHFSIINSVIYTCRFRLWRCSRIERSCASKVSRLRSFDRNINPYENLGLHETGPAEGCAAQAE